MLVLDSGGLSRLSERSTFALALIRALRQQRLWPPVVPSAVLIESLTGDGRRDARTHRLLKACDVLEELSQGQARRAAFLRTKAKRGSPVDALVVATAEPGGTVLTSDAADIRALAEVATGVEVEVV